MEAKKIIAGISVRNKFLLRLISMETNKPTTNDNVAIAQMSFECKQVLAKLIASNDRDLNIIAQLITNEADYKRLKRLVHKRK